MKSGARLRARHDDFTRECHRQAQRRRRAKPASAAEVCRYARHVFERFTERARQVVVLAQDEARALKHNYIGTEHILLGLLREEEGLAARVLESLDVTVEEVRMQVARIIGQSHEHIVGQIPFTPRAKKVLELSLREALALGHNYIGTEHILLGLARENQGVAARILLDFGADADRIRREVIELLSGARVAEHVAAEQAVHHAERVEETFQPLAQRAPLIHWTGIATGAMMLGAGVLIGWVIWG
jgi:ATP-dependent Clp protease ATP-binding subunit ClpA